MFQSTVKHSTCLENCWVVPALKSFSKLKRAHSERAVVSQLLSSTCKDDHEGLLDQAPNSEFDAAEFDAKHSADSAVFQELSDYWPVGRCLANFGFTNPWGLQTDFKLKQVYVQQIW